MVLFLIEQFPYLTLAVMTKDELSAAIAANVRRQRKALGLSIGALADRADVGEDYLGHVERGRKCPSLEVLAKIASGLGTEPEDLLKKAPAAGSGGSANQRLLVFLRGMSEAQKADVLAILAKLKRADRIHALRVAVGA